MEKYTRISSITIFPSAVKIVKKSMHRRLKSFYRSYLSLELLDNRYPALHGLRVIAIASIVMFHVNQGLPDFLVYEKKRLWFGMDLFFVMSGFLVGGILFHTHQNGTISSFTRFYLRRAFRILPAYYATLFLLLSYRLVFRGIDSFELSNILRELFFFTNYPYSNDAYVMGWSWSLSLEEHFYLVIPFLVLFIKALPPKLTACFFVLTFLTPIVIRQHGLSTAESMFVDVYTPTHMRFDTLIMGVMLAYLLKHHEERVKAFMLRRYTATAVLCLGLGLLCLLIAFPLPVWGPPGPVQNRFFVSLMLGTITSCAYAALILWAIYGRGVLIRLLSAKICRVIATLGYGIYLIHTPVIKLFSIILPLEGYFLWACCLVGALGASAVFAYFLHVLVERPMLRIRERYYRV